MDVFFRNGFCLLSSMRVSTGIAVVAALLYGAPPLQAAERIACVGTSITEGVGILDGHSYPDQLKAMLTSTYDVRNFGVGGAAVIRHSGTPYCTTSAFRAVFTYAPTQIVIELGTNDSPTFAWNADTFATDYRWLVDTFKTIASVKTIYVCTPTPAWSDFHSINEATISGQIAPFIRSFARSNGVRLIELHDQFIESNLSDCFPDGVHPNQEGAGYIALAVFNELTAPAHVALTPHTSRQSIGGSRMLDVRLSGTCRGNANIAPLFDICGRRLPGSANAVWGMGIAAIEPRR